MGYLSDNEALEQAEKAQEDMREETDFDRMLDCYGLTEQDWQCISGNEQRQKKWNWVNIMKRGAAFQ